jgi:predicted component of type VI protein secretion system
MALELRIAGPGFDVVRRLEDGQPELVLGRDADCGVCLPDPQRNVSRRHLSVWVEAGELHFHVLSAVNGVDMPFGEAPPGARGVLPAGQTLKLADYSLTATAAPPADASAAPHPDPWAVFDRDGSGIVSMSAAHRAAAAGAHAGKFHDTGATDDDPFGDWGFETTFGPGPGGAGPLQAEGLGPDDLRAFFRGLGLDPATVGPLSQGELQAIGELVRDLALGILELHAAASGVKEDLRSEDRTMVAPRDTNPLKRDWDDETKLRYLFGGRATGIGFTSPERALRDLLSELLAHQQASAVATRETLAGLLREFAPAALKEKLLGGGGTLFEAAKAWNAYAKYYEQHGADVPAWAQRLLDRYFTETYVREILRIRRETAGRQR